MKVLGTTWAWATRHKVWASVIGVFLFLFLVGSIGSAVGPVEDETTKAAVEKTAKPTPSPTNSRVASSPSATPVPMVTTAKPKATKKVPKLTAVGKCNSRPPKGSEIYVRYLSNGDDPPNSTSLGAGYSWDFGTKECVTSVEMALRSDSGLPGYCTQVAYIDDNPGYDVDRIPSLPFKRLLAMAGDC